MFRALREKLGAASAAAKKPINALPSSFAAGNAWPNPFNAATTLTVTLPETSELAVRVYDLTGRAVAELAQGSFTAGQHALSFDGSHLASGIYFAHAVVPGKLSEIRKLTLIK